MTDNTQPEALRLANALEYCDASVARQAINELRSQHARIADLETQLEAIGAGGVSGPLMGQPQAMPDLTALTERGAKAWAGVDAQALREGRWYMVTHDGVATLCEDRRDAEKEAKDADMAWPHSGPHRAVQLVEASMAGYTAADMATASAQGFRDGAASAMAGEPMAWMTFTEEGDPDMVFLDRLEACQYCEDDDPPKPLYLAAPPTAQAEGWTKASKQLPPCRGDQLYIGVNSAGYAGVFNAVASIAGNVHCMYETPEETIDVMSDLSIWKPFTPPTSAEGVEHG